MIIRQEADDVNCMAGKIKECEKRGLKINCGKTEHLSRNPSVEMEIDGNKIKTVKTSNIWNQ
jgi:hypothetical protein